MPLFPIPSWITLPRAPTSSERVFWYPFTADPVLHEGQAPLQNNVSGSGTNITIHQEFTGIPVDYPRADWAAIGTPPLPTGQITQIYGVVQGSFTNVNGFASVESPTVGNSFGIVGSPVDWAGVIITSFAGAPLQPDPTTFPWDTFDLSMHNYSSVTWAWDGIHPSLFSITDVGFLIYATVGKIILEKITDPAGSPQAFDFTSSYGPPFTLHDGESNESIWLAPGTYTVTEEPVSGWTTATNIDPSAISVVANETIFVIFTNSKIPVPPPPPSPPPPPEPPPDTSKTPPCGLLNDKLNTTSWAITVSTTGIPMPVQIPYNPNLPTSLLYVSRSGKELWDLKLENVGDGLGILQTFPRGLVGRGPQIMLRWSDDGGHTWSKEYRRDCGQTGEYHKRIIWNRLGRSRDRVYEISVTDPAIWRIIEAYLFTTTDPEPQERFVSMMRKKA